MIVKPLEFYMEMYKYAPDIQSETRFIGIPKDLTGTCIAIKINSDGN